MQILYITLNTVDEARQVSRALLEQQLAVCINWFPITCMYRWQGEIKEEPEVVLIVKTQDNYREEIEAVVKTQIDYTNCVAVLPVEAVNEGFLSWLDAEVAGRG